MLYKPNTIVRLLTSVRFEQAKGYTPLARIAETNSRPAHANYSLRIRIAEYVTRNIYYRYSRDREWWISRSKIEVIYALQV